MAMRAQAEAQVEPSLAEEESEISSPGASTTTGVSGGSSFGLQMRGGGSWCTPPRIFIEHQVRVIDRRIFLHSRWCFLNALSFNDWELL